ncbi:MAG TPA: right-handed parallel beta-helix repeat-containing protein, partial [Fibrella sp.]
MSVAEYGDYQRITSTLPVDLITVLSVNGLPGERWIMRSVPKITAAMLGSDPTIQLQRVIDNQVNRSIELSGAIGNIGRIRVKGQTIYLNATAVITGRALTTSEQAGIVDYGIFELSEGGRIIGPGLIDGNKTVRNFGSAHGIYFNGTTTDVELRGFRVVDTNTDGVRFQGASKVTVADVQVKGSVFRGIHGITTNDVTLSNCRVDGGTHGIQWYGGDTTYCTNWSITDCRVKNLQLGGIWGVRGEAITITGGSAELCGDVGIDFELCRKSSANGVFVKDCLQSGLAVFNASTDIEFNDCIVMQAAGMGPAFKAWGNNIPGLTGKSSNIRINGGSLKNQPEQVCVATEQGQNEKLSFNDVRMSGYAVQLLDAHECEVIDCKLDLYGPFGIRNLGGKGFVAKGNRINYKGTAPTAANDIVLTYRSVEYPATNCIISDNIQVGYGGGITDDDQNGPLSKSGNIIINNLTQSVNRPPNNKDYTTLKSGNYKTDGTLLESAAAGSNKADLFAITNQAGGYAPILTLPASAANTYDYTNLIVSVGAWGGTAVKTLDIIVGQRDGFHLTYSQRGDSAATGKVVAYQNTNGSTTLYVTLGTFGRATVNYLSVVQAVPVTALTFTQSVPSGTLIFDSSTTGPAASGSTPYTLPPASNGSLGGVIPGYSLSVNSTGTLSFGFASTAELTAYMGTDIYAYVQGFSYPFKWVVNTNTPADGYYCVLGKGRTSAQSGRWVNQNPEVLVDEYGAEGSGLVNDRPAIQAAVNYASFIATQNGGNVRATVRFGPGIYYVDQMPVDITNRNGVFLQGSRSRYVSTHINGNTNGPVFDFTGAIMGGCDGFTFTSYMGYPQRSTIGVLYGLSQNPTTGQQIGGLNCSIDNCFFEFEDNPSANGGIGNIGVLNIRGEEFRANNLLIKCNMGMLFSNKRDLSAIAPGFTITSQFVKMHDGVGSMGVVDIANVSIQNVNKRREAIALIGCNSFRIQGYLSRTSQALGTHEGAIGFYQQLDNIEYQGTIEGFSTVAIFNGSLCDNIRINTITANQTDTTKPVFDVTNAAIFSSHMTVAFGNIGEFNNGRRFLYHDLINGGDSPSAGGIQNSSFTCSKWVDNNLFVTGNILRNASNVYFNTGQPFKKIGLSVMDCKAYAVPLGNVSAGNPEIVGTILRFNKADKTTKTSGNGGLYQVNIKGVISAGALYTSGGNCAVDFESKIILTQNQNGNLNVPAYTTLIFNKSLTNYPYLDITDINAEIDLSGGIGIIRLKVKNAGNGTGEVVKFH